MSYTVMQSALNAEKASFGGVEVPQPNMQATPTGRPRGYLPGLARRRDTLPEFALRTSGGQPVARCLLPVACSLFPVACLSFRFRLVPLRSAAFRSVPF